MTKRFVALMLAFIMAIPAFGSVSVSAEDVFAPDLDLNRAIPTQDQPQIPTDDSAKYSMFTFELSEDGEFYILTSCNQTTLSAEVPEIYKGLPVREIGEGAFYGCEALESVILPQSVRKIDTEAFKYCISLKEILLPEDLRTIGDEAFSYCESLESLEIPANVRDIGGWATAFCNSLKALSVAEENKNYYSVDNCIIHKSSKTLVLGCNYSEIPADGSVTSIGYAAFAGCDKISEIVIPASVTEIEDSAFSHCAALETIEIPANVEKMGAIVFAECEGLAEIRCESAEKPAEWSERWIDYCDATVYWAGVPEEKPEDPSENPSEPSDEPSDDPSDDPSNDPSDDPSDEPSDEPSVPTDDQPSVPTDDQPDNDEEPKKGDVNGNRIIDAMDYVYIKRAYFGTYKLKDVTVGDINKNNIIDSMDYVYLKRAYFGTYKIK